MLISQYLNFGGLSEHCDYNSSRFIILPIPYDHTTSYMPGARRGPLAILEASTHMELFDEEFKTSPFTQGIHTLPFMEPNAASPAEMIQLLQNQAAEIINDGKILIILGGEHSISLAPISAYKEIYPDLAVIQFDAHADLRDSFEGTRYSHACVMRRVHDLGIPIAQIGIRSLSEEENKFLSQEKICTIYQHDGVTGRDWIERIESHFLNHGIAKDSKNALSSIPVYLTFDLDCLDPSIMPATGTPEPGGLDYHTVLRLLKKICAIFNIVGFDVVELSPLPGIVAPDFLAARLIYKIITYIVGNK